MAALAVAACGGGSEPGTQDLAVSSLPLAAQAAVAGDWPLPSGKTAAVVARNAADWQAVWAQRRSQLNCNLSHNLSACAAVVAPSIDLAGQDLVGVVLASSCEFQSPAPSRVFLDANAARLAVEFSYVCIFKAPFAPEPTRTLFFLVPKNSLAVELRGREL